MTPDEPLLPVVPVAPVDPAAPAAPLAPVKPLLPVKSDALSKALVHWWYAWSDSAHLLALPRAASHPVIRHMKARQEGSAPVAPDKPLLPVAPVAPVEPAAPAAPLAPVCPEFPEKKCTFILPPCLIFAQLSAAKACLAR